MKRSVQKTKRKIVTKLILALLLIAAYFVSGIIRGHFNKQEDTVAADIEEKFSYHFIDVGQGSSTLVLSGENSVLIDAGPADHTSTTVQYIQQLTDKIDIMILTHPHEDHIGAAHEIVNNFKVETVVMPDASSEIIAFEKLLDAIEKNDCSVVEGKPDVSLNAGEIKIELYGPVLTEYNDFNNASIFAKLITDEVSLMITGDAESAAEKAVLENTNEYFLDSDILVAGHHGSSTSTTPDFFNAVTPSHAVISCGRDNSYGHPHREITELFEKHSVKLYRTDTMGSVKLISDGKKIALSGSYT